ncbi:hypothetical protein VTK73DRAFT_5235 [Phialemonium thermophilum]|uniref:Uncharacterized protein n=1 Tax=Phialemonium thermophilum TaxID=223376 RepID=A0ABR3V326_9PEZI
MQTTKTRYIPVCGRQAREVGRQAVDGDGVLAPKLEKLGWRFHSTRGVKPAADRHSGLPCRRCTERTEKNAPSCPRRRGRSAQGTSGGWRLQHGVLVVPCSESGWVKTRDRQVSAVREGWDRRNAAYWFSQQLCAQWRHATRLFRYSLCGPARIARCPSSSSQRGARRLYWNGLAPDMQVSAPGPGFPSSSPILWPHCLSFHGLSCLDTSWYGYGRKVLVLSSADGGYITW